MLKGSREEGKHGLKIKKQLGALFSSNTADISPKRPTSAQRKTAVDMSGSDFAVEPDLMHQYHSSGARSRLVPRVCAAAG